eukprot:118181_1
MSQPTIQNVHLYHKHNRAHSQVTIAKIGLGEWDSKGNQWTFNDKSMANKVQSPSTTVKLDCFTSTSPSKSQILSSSLEIMTSSPESSIVIAIGTVSATPAMDQDKGAIKKDKNVIMKGKDAIGHDKRAIRVIGIIGGDKNIKNLSKEKTPQKKQQAAQEHMSDGEKSY